MLKFRLKALSAAIAAAAIGVAAPAWSEEDQIEEIVVTGSYIKQNLDHVKVSISPRDLAAFVQGYDGYYAFLRERMAGQSWLELTYEGLIAEKENEIQRVCDWLDVDVQNGVSVLDLGVERDVVRQNTRSLRESVENYEQLRAAFIGTDGAADFDA